MIFLYLYSIQLLIYLFKHVSSKSKLINELHKSYLVLEKMFYLKRLICKKLLLK